MRVCIYIYMCVCVCLSLAPYSLNCSFHSYKFVGVRHSIAMEAMERCMKLVAGKIGHLLWVFTIKPKKNDVWENGKW